jgi:hypothetical protein
VRIEHFDPVAERHDRLMQSGEKPAPIRFRYHQMIAMSPAKSHIFVRRIDLSGLEDAFETMRLCFAAEKSEDTGKIIRMDELPTA